MMFWVEFSFEFSLSHPPLNWFLSWQIVQCYFSTYMWKTHMWDFKCYTLSYVFSYISGGNLFRRPLPRIYFPCSLLMNLCLILNYYFFHRFLHRSFLGRILYVTKEGRMIIINWLFVWNIYIPIHFSLLFSCCAFTSGPYLKLFSQFTSFLQVFGDFPNFCGFYDC